MGPKRSTLLFLLVIASLLSAVLAGGHRKLIVNSELNEQSVLKEYKSPKILLHDHYEAFVGHPRILTVKTNDYGRYDPSPSLAKPPFKLIPN